MQAAETCSGVLDRSVSCRQEVQYMDLASNGKMKLQRWSYVAIDAHEHQFSMSIYYIKQQAGEAKQCCLQSTDHHV